MLAPAAPATRAPSRRTRRLSKPFPAAGSPRSFRRFLGIGTSLSCFLIVLLRSPAVGHDGRVEIGSVDAGVGQNRIGEIGAFEIGTAQIGGIEIRSEQVRAGKLCMA